MPPGVSTSARVGILLCAAWLLAVSAAAQEPAQPARTDADPTRAILFSVRPEFARIADGVWRQQFIARYDRAVKRERRWLGGKRGMLLRFELPISAANTPAAAAQAGFGDAYAQVLLIPWMTGRFAFVAGTGASLPTATSQGLGTGKVILAPAVLPVWFIRGRGLAYLKVQAFRSVAGDADRPDVHFLLITPTLIHTIGRSSWVLVDTETKTDWRSDSRTGVKSGVQYGRILRNGTGVWVKPEIWWGPNRDGRWNLKTGFVWYR